VWISKRGAGVSVDDFRITAEKVNQRYMGAISATHRGVHNGRSFLFYFNYRKTVLLVNLAEIMAV